MSSPALDNPASVEAELEVISRRLALLANEMEQAAEAWFPKKAEREFAHAQAYARAKGGHSERREAGTVASAMIGVAEEGAWEGKRHVQKALETQSMVLAALLKSQGRYVA